MSAPPAYHTEQMDAVAGTEWFNEIVHEADQKITLFRAATRAKGIHSYSDELAVALG
jgi:hypothetical protein